MATAAAAGLDFDALYRENRAYIFHLCHRFFNNLEDAEDMTQEVFLHIAAVPEGKRLPRWRQFQGENGCKFRTWLHQVAKNLCLMKLRLDNARRAHARMSSLDELMQGDEEGNRFSPLARQESPEVAITVWRAIQEMPPGYKAVATLRLYYGMEHQEVARELKFTAGCSKSQCHKAMQRLRLVLQPAEARNVR